MHPWIFSDQLWIIPCHMARGLGGNVFKFHLIFHLFSGFSWRNSESLFKTNDIFIVFPDRPKKEYPNAATWSSSVWQLGAVLGPALQD